MQKSVKILLITACVCLTSTLWANSATIPVTIQVFQRLKNHAPLLLKGQQVLIAYQNTTMGNPQEVWPITKSDTGTITLNLPKKEPANTWEIQKVSPYPGGYDCDITKPVHLTVPDTAPQPVYFVCQGQ